MQQKENQTKKKKQTPVKSLLILISNNAVC